MSNTLEMRVLEVFKYSGLNRIDFANKLGVSNAVMSHISSGRNKAGTELILNILTQFQDISADWLLLGNGEMLRSNMKKDNEKLKLILKERLQQINAAETRLRSLTAELETYINDEM